MGTFRKPDDPDVSMVITARDRDLGGGAMVKRFIPHAMRRSIGPWVFIDHFGRGTTKGERERDVRPHPHIGLATVTYLFEGESFHRDSMGVQQPVLPGDINLMSAGKGVVHSERAPEHLRGVEHVSHGLQLWMALPQDMEDAEPSFAHHDEDELPNVTTPDFEGRVLIGSAWGQTSPVATPRRTLYALGTVNGTVTLPEEAELSVVVLSGNATVGTTDLTAGEIAVTRSGAPLTADGARVVILGGDPLDGPRFMAWNFVASSQERIKAAALRWKNQEFPTIPGDDQEFIPLPEALA